MTQEDAPRKPAFVSPTEAIAKRLRALRVRRGWSARELGDRCAAVGMATLDRTAITNIEIGRRQKVSVDELLVLAFVLDVAPLHLLVPVDATIGDLDPKAEAPDRPVLYKITPERFAIGPAAAREWVRGNFALPYTDTRIYFSEVPPEEWEPPQRPAEDVIERRGRAAEAARRIVENKGGES
ncbi:helix-turn-helix domain-containing protein [Nonomuraea sp. NPDC049714]|uniref:helix-turn-helix domain-containing protein n=1 Tax=Nonomuraea sp. NPDC049714 TaxID=3364357 RepID=UPI0037B3A2F2